MLCDTLNFEPVIFDAVDENDREIYHTNVIMSVGSNFCVVCLEAIKDGVEKTNLLAMLEKTNKAVITITLAQVNEMCGNVLELTDTNGQKKLLMSQRAYDNFTSDQRDQLKRFANLVPVDIANIENVGGGSVRCMLARVPGVVDL